MSKIRFDSYHTIISTLWFSRLSHKSVMDDWYFFLFFKRICLVFLLYVLFTLYYLSWIWNIEKNLYSQGLRLANDEIARLRNTDTKTVLCDKKLYLILDLDFTLLNSIRLSDISPNEEYLRSKVDSLQGTFYLILSYFVIANCLIILIYLLCNIQLVCVFCARE